MTAKDICLFGTNWYSVYPIFAPCPPTRRTLNYYVDSPPPLHPPSPVAESWSCTVSQSSQSETHEIPAASRSKRAVPPVKRLNKPSAESHRCWSTLWFFQLSVLESERLLAWPAARSASRHSKTGLYQAARATHPLAGLQSS